jgi:hypothetical protein
MVLKAGVGTHRPEVGFGPSIAGPVGPVNFKNSDILQPER